MRWKHCPELKQKLNSKSHWWGQAAGVDYAASSWRGSSGIFFSFFLWMILVSWGSVGSTYAVHLAFSGSAWYVLFILMWWIQGVTPVTLTAVGVLRTTVYGPLQCGVKESCFQSLTHTWSIVTNLWISSPRGNCILSCTNLVTDLLPYPVVHLLWNLISLYLRQICWHLFYYGRGPPIYNFVWRIAMAPWDHPEPKQSHRKQVHPVSVSLYDPLGECLSKCLVGSFHHPRTLGPICCM